MQQSRTELPGMVHIKQCLQHKMSDNMLAVFLQQTNQAFQKTKGCPECFVLF